MMQSSTSIYGSQTILNEDERCLAASRCRSSIKNKSTAKCRHLLRSCRSSLVPSKLYGTTIRQQLFAKLCRNHRLLLVLNDYICQCGCRFVMRQCDFVILYQTNKEATFAADRRLVTVISNELVCSKVPSNYVCDVNVLRERVRERRLYSDDEQSFDL